MAAFAVGTSVEYKYKNKHWMNGTIKEKNKSSLTIATHKSIKQMKSIEIKMSEVMTCYHVKKTLKISNQVFPSWIKVHANVIMLNKFGKFEHAAIAQYRDGKFITFYFPRQLHEQRLMKIKQSDIVYIDNERIYTSRDCGIEIRLHDSQEAVSHQTITLHDHDNSVFNAIGFTLKNSFEIPLEISAMIYECLVSHAFARMYHEWDILRPRESAKVWPVNNRSVIGVMFQTQSDLKCTGVEIHANFGKVKTFIILKDHVQDGFGHKTVKGEMDAEYGDHFGARKFRWCSHENIDGVRKFRGGKHITLKAMQQYTIGFFISDGTSVVRYLDCVNQVARYSSLKHFEYVQWKRFENNRFLQPVEQVADWYPLVRLLLVQSDKSAS